MRKMKKFLFALFSCHFVCFKVAIAENFKAILWLLGEDPQREGLKDTPMRAAQAMSFYTKGYDDTIENAVKKVKIFTFWDVNHATSLTLFSRGFSTRTPTRWWLSKTLSSSPCANTTWHPSMVKSASATFPCKRSWGWASWQGLSKSIPGDFKCKRDSQKRSQRWFNNLWGGWVEGATHGIGLCWRFQTFRKPILFVIHKCIDIQTITDLTFQRLSWKLQIPEVLGLSSRLPTCAWWWEEFRRSTAKLPPVAC